MTAPGSGSRILGVRVGGVVSRTPRVPRLRRRLGACHGSMLRVTTGSVARGRGVCGGVIRP
ncbi:MAG TPA: hypothetical protein VKI41_18570, partial [Vicinamibacteria bacterium]|nr:hypothetical protein [Vicinamibacteria bacterium]